MKKLIVILIVLILLTGGGYWYFTFVRNAKQVTDPNTPLTVKDFLPFGTGQLLNPSPAQTAPEPNPTPENVNGESSFLPSKFHQITNFAVAGATFFEDIRPIIKTEKENPTVTTPPLNSTPTTKKQTAKTATPAPPKEPEFEVASSIKYVERSNGHIYQRYLDTNAEGKISNTTIPSIYEAFFGNDSKSLIYRYLSSDGETISSFLGTLGGSSGEFLTENISSISISPDETRFFYLLPFGDGVAGIIKSFNDTKKTQIFTSAFTEWLTQWPNNKIIYLTTKASASAVGYLYSLDTSSGAFKEVFGNVYGLTTLVSPNGNLVLYSYSTASGSKLAIFNIQTRDNLDLGLSGLSEKCVWGNDSLDIYCGIPNTISGNQPDSWYQGLTSFNDGFVKINPTASQNSTIAESPVNIDAINLFLDNKKGALFFVNKKDSTLWSLDLR